MGLPRHILGKDANGKEIPNREYFEERKPFLDRLKGELEPLWERFLNREIDLGEYTRLVQPHISRYCKDPEFDKIWKKHGGT